MNWSLSSEARGDVVLDPFLGSGTALIACERTGRVCYGIEANPQGVDMIVRHGDSPVATLCRSRLGVDELAELARLVSQIGGTFA